MNEQEFQNKVAELLGEITTLPQVARAAERAKLAAAANGHRNAHDRLAQSAGSLQESVDYLRLSIKYVLFDLEATRRENAALRSLLQSTDNSADDLV